VRAWDGDGSAITSDVTDRVAWISGRSTAAHAALSPAQAALIARATAPWCLAEAVPRIAPAKVWFVFTAFATPVVVAIGASFAWLAMP
jgi:hypothetical protein